MSTPTLSFPRHRPVSVAPMMEWTDRHCRYFMRLISRHAVLYTEMVTSSALIHGDAAHLLKYDASEQPLALQLGGSEPAELAHCARLAQDHGYAEINLNVGCPSDRVQSGRFGACLMAEPQLVADCIAAMRSVVTLPVTVKTRIGIDDQDSYEALQDFITTVANAACDTFIIHARKAWLSGLSPKENREIPPLRYDVVQRLKRDFPQITIVLNGGITRLDQAQQELNHVDGVMIGREAYHNPYMLAQVDTLFYGDDHPIPSRHEILEQFIPYVERQLHAGIRLSSISRHILGLFLGMPGARAWRRYLSENTHSANGDINVLRYAAKLVSDAGSLHSNC